jgi:hypothetical protein
MQEPIAKAAALFCACFFLAYAFYTPATQAVTRNNSTFDQVGAYSTDLDPDDDGGYGYEEADASLVCNREGAGRMSVIFTDRDGAQRRYNYPLNAAFCRNTAMGACRRGSALYGVHVSGSVFGNDFIVPCN